jgi:glycosyltransferase involved in cell wall biosynthesis
MRITWLLEVADQLWGGVKVALEDANWLQQQGHEVTVVSRSGPPAWLPLRCRFLQVRDFHSSHLPAGDVLLATFWTTMPWAVSAGPEHGVPVHFCQGYEGDAADQAALRDRIEAAYRLPGLHHLTITPHLTRLLRDRFGLAATELPYTIDHAVFQPAPPRAAQAPLRVGLVGPYQIPWKGLATGYEACRLAQAAGQPVVLVRATNTEVDPRERNQPFPVEWHHRVAPQRMGDFYHSLDLLIATSTGADEGFFLPAVEAMACGVPTVLTDIPCFRDHAAKVGHDRYGVFVPPNDPAALAEAIVCAGRLPTVRQSLRTAGLELAAHYRQETHGQALLAALQHIVAQAGQRHPLRLVAAASAATAAEPPPRPELETLAAALSQCGEAAQQRGDWVTAARAHLAAHAATPTHPARHRAAALAQSAAGSPGEALRLWDTLLATGADDAACHQGRGEAQHALGDAVAAAQSFRAALAVGPRTADAYNRLGVVLYQAGDLAGARDSFERALVLQPDHDDARANLQALPAA